jgi:pectinesterase
MKSILIILVLIGGLADATGQTKFDFVVAKDGSADFTTIQEALNAVPDFRKNVTSIFIKTGIYKEKLILAGSKTNVRIVGEEVTKTIITYDDYASKKNKFGEEMGTTGSTTFFVFGEGFTAEKITFENSSGPVGQAVAVRIDGDMVTFNDCRFLGFQDTLYPHGEKSRQYYKNCYVEGTVDFIFGWSTALFEDCTIFCKKGGGYVTAASTLPETKHGFVFLNCRITGDAEPSTYYLGRPWRPHAKTVFINCYLDRQIRPEGWHNWNKPEAEMTSFYGEFGSNGPGVGSRVPWSHQIKLEEVSEYTKEKILGNWSEPVKR